MDPRLTLRIAILGPAHASESFVETQQRVRHRTEPDQTRFRSFRAWFCMAKLSAITCPSHHLSPDLRFFVSVRMMFAFPRNWEQLLAWVIRRRYQIVKHPSGFLSCAHTFLLSRVYIDKTSPYQRTNVFSFSSPLDINLTPSCSMAMVHMSCRNFCCTWCNIHHLDYSCQVGSFLSLTSFLLTRRLSYQYTVASLAMPG